MKPTSVSIRSAGGHRHRASTRPASRPPTAVETEGGDSSRRAVLAPPRPAPLSGTGVAETWRLTGAVRPSPNSRQSRFDARPLETAAVAASRRLGGPGPGSPRATHSPGATPARGAARRAGDLPRRGVRPFPRPGGVAPAGRRRPGGDASAAGVPGQPDHGPGGAGDVPGLRGAGDARHPAGGPPRRPRARPPLRPNPRPDAPVGGRREPPGVLPTERELPPDDLRGERQPHAGPPAAEPREADHPLSVRRPRHPGPDVGLAPGAPRARRGIDGARRAGGAQAVAGQCGQRAAGAGGDPSTGRSTRGGASWGSSRGGSR